MGTGRGTQQDAVDVVVVRCGDELGPELLGHHCSRARRPSVIQVQLSDAVDGD